MGMMKRQEKGVDGGDANDGNVDVNEKDELRHLTQNWPFATHECGSCPHHVKYRYYFLPSTVVM